MILRFIVAPVTAKSGLPTVPGLCTAARLSSLVTTTVRIPDAKHSSSSVGSTNTTELQDNGTVELTKL